jgi:small redox-active disulfide protein 2
MKQIKVLGPGCRRCDLTARVIQKQAETLGVEVALEKVTDMAEIMGYGVLSTPGVVVDGEVVHAGGVPDVRTARRWLRDG